MMRLGLPPLSSMKTIWPSMPLSAPFLPFLPLLSPGLMGWARMSDSAHHSNWWRLSWASWAALARSTGSPMTR